MAAVPSDDLARYGLFPEKIKKVGQRPAVERIKVSQLHAAKRVIEGKGRRSVQEGEKDPGAGRCTDHAVLSAFRRGSDAPAEVPFLLSFAAKVGQSGLTCCMDDWYW